MTGATGGAESRDAGSHDIWARFDVSVLATDTPAPVVKTKKAPTGPPTVKQRARWWLLHAVSLVVWLWVILKVFVGDVDRWLVANLAPGLQWLLDYRFFGLLLFMAVLSVVINRKSWWMPLFVAFWPMLLLLFYLPRFMYRRRNVAVSVGIIHAFFGFVRSLRFTLVSLALVAFGILGIFVSRTSWILILCSLALVGVWTVSLVKTFRYAVSPGRFVSGQMRMWRRLYNSDAFWRFVDVDDELRAPEIKKFNQQQANAIVTSLSFGLASTRLGQFWAEQLEVYRRSPATILAGCLAVVGLFLQGVVTFTFANMAIFKMDSTEFISAYVPSFTTFLYYTFASASFGEVSALVPKGAWATTANLLTGFGTGVVVLMLAVSLVLGFRQSRVDEAATRSIEKLRREADSFEDRLADEYGLGREELFTRLDEIGGGLLRLMPFLITGNSDRWRRPSQDD